MAVPQKFKAWVYDSLAGKLEDNLKLTDVVTPPEFEKPKAGKVLIEVLASALNPADYKVPESSIESRVVAVRKPASPGFDFCGRLVAQPDRVVFGKLAWPDQYGSLSQFVLVTENDITDLPKNFDIAQAAAVPTAALTAYQSLASYVKPGDRVLVNGSSGGVGTFTVQIAKLMGCYVVATCSSKNVQLCKDLRADEVVDYTKGDIVAQLAGQEPFDCVIDNVGLDPTLHKRSIQIMKSNGWFVLVSGMLGSFAGVLSMAESLLRPWWLGGVSSRYSIILCKPNKVQLEQLAVWVADKQLRVIIDEIFDFEDAPRAISKLRTGRACGKIVVRGVHFKS